jgi:hypothetical protein
MRKLLIGLRFLFLPPGAFWYVKPDIPSTLARHLSSRARGDPLESSGLLARAPRSAKSIIKPFI